MITRANCENIQLKIKIKHQMTAIKRKKVDFLNKI